MLRAVLVREQTTLKEISVLFSAVVMEDLNGYSILRAELMEGRVEPAAIEGVMTAIGAIHKQSLCRNLSKEKWKELVTKFRCVVCENLQMQNNFYYLFLVTRTWLL